jgi:hypothetical protein
MENNIKFNNDNSFRSIYTINSTQGLGSIKKVYDSLNYFYPDEFFIETGDGGRTQLNLIGLNCTISSELNNQKSLREDVNPMIGDYRTLSYIILIKSKNNPLKVFKFLPKIFNL